MFGWWWWGREKKLRLWVVADAGEAVGSQSFWGVLNKETEKLFFFSPNRLVSDSAEVQFLIVNVDGGRENKEVCAEISEI